MTRRLTLQQSLTLVWRTLRSMRTALILLLLLAVAAVAGSLIPQWPNTPERVAAYLREHPFWGGVYQRAGLFDVFGSWWFVLITTLLFVSLVACLIPRTRAAIRSARERPVQAREIDVFRHYAERVVPAGADAAIASSRSVLRRRWFRIAGAKGQPALAADKGRARELGSLLFHWAFLLLLVGVIVGKGTGFTGRAVIVEGRGWTDARANYDGQLRTGRFFGEDFTGIQVRLNDFEDRYRRTGIPMDFVSVVDVDAADGSSLARGAEIRVNHPLEVEGVRLFQYGFGYAVDVTVRDADGRPIYREPVRLQQRTAPDGVPQLAMPWEGTIRLPSNDPPTVIGLELWPDSRAFVATEPVAALEPHDPVILYRTFVQGDRGMRRGPTGAVGEGKTEAVGEGEDATGLSLEFSGLRQYSVLQVSRDRGVPLVLLAAILILAGLLPALYGSRRKIWVRAEPNGAGTVLKVGGFALQRKGQFEEEFERLVDAMAQASGASSGAKPTERTSGAKP